MKRAIITGATGFIGAALCKKLTISGWSVLGFIQTNENITPGHNIELISGFKLETSNMPKNSFINTQCLIHTAARVHVMQDSTVDLLHEFRKVNVEGTLRLAKQAAAAGVKRFILLSSVKVHGESSQIGQPFRESDQVVPESPYALSKYEAELKLMEIAKTTSMELVIIRPPLVYGAGAKGNFRILLNWIQKGIPLPLGAINNRRSFVGIDNLVDFIITCLEHPKAANQIFFVSDGEDLSTTELLKRAAMAMGRPARLIPVPPVIIQIGAKVLGKKEVAQRLLNSLQVDISKAQNLLGWTPPLSINEGLSRCAREI